MTDKQDTHDRTHTTGHAEGRRRASGGAHTEDGSRHGDGDTTEHSRRRTAATEHTAGRRIGGQAEGSTKTTHGSRQGTGREQTDRKKYVIYLRER